MRVMIKMFLIVFLWMVSVTAMAAEPTPLNPKGQVVVDLFISSTCIHCLHAKHFFQQLQMQYPWVKVNQHVVNLDKEALKSFYQHLKLENSNNFAVPAVFFCGSHWVGFDSRETTGAWLLQSLDYCHHELLKTGTLSRTAANVLKQSGTAGQVSVMTNGQSNLSIVSMMAFFDMFSSCSLFSFVTFLGFITLYPQRRWLQALLGITFTSSLAVVHAVRQLYPIVYQQLLVQLRWPAALIGGVLLVYIAYYIQTKRGKCTHALAGLACLIMIPTEMVVQLYQQTCSINVPMIFERWLNMQTFTPVMRHLFFTFYHTIYVLPAIILIIVFFIWGRSKSLSCYFTEFEAMGCFLLFSIGSILIVYPMFFASLALSLSLLVIAVIFGCVVARRLLARQM